MNFIKINKNIIFSLVYFTFFFGSEKKIDEAGTGYDFSAGNSSLFRVGDYDLPGNPMLDRAKGYSIQGKVKNGVLNFGAYVDWDYNPSGAWGQYAYLPSVAFMAGVPGYINIGQFEWILEELENSNNAAWVSEEAYDAWAESTTNAGIPNRFSGIVYNVEDDRGIIALQRSSIDDFGTTRFECTISGYTNEQDCESNYILDQDGNQIYGVWSYKNELAFYASESVYEWYMDNASGKIYLVMLEDEIDPNSIFSNAGLIFPWSFRPK